MNTERQHLLPCKKSASIYPLLCYITFHPIFTNAQLYSPDTNLLIENKFSFHFYFMNEGGYKISDQYATYFMTFTVVGWVDLFTRKECAQILIDSFSYCQENKGLIMGSHVHILSSAAYESKGMSAIVRDFKTFTSKKIIEWIMDNQKESRREWLDIIFQYYGKYNLNNNTYQVWQQHNRPMLCLTPEFTLQKLNYIHNNPVKSGIVDRLEDYRYSSARNYLGNEDVVLKVQLIDYGPLIGYIHT